MCPKNSKNPKMSRDLPASQMCSTQQAQRGFIEQRILRNISARRKIRSNLDEVGFFNGPFSMTLEMLRNIKIKDKHYQIEHNIYKIEQE